MMKALLGIAMLALAVGSIAVLAHPARPAPVTIEVVPSGD